MIEPGVAVAQTPLHDALHGGRSDQGHEKVAINVSDSPIPFSH
jgi:pyrrolidone-carboxylate peptidase